MQGDRFVATVRQIRLNWPLFLFNFYFIYFMNIKYKRKQKEWVIQLGSFAEYFKNKKKIKI